MRPLIITSLVVCSLQAFPQGFLNPLWTKTHKATITNGQCEGWGVDTDPSGNVYWPVSFDSVNTSKQYDIATYKFDANGNPQWKTYFSGAGIQHAFVCNAKDTFLYVGGRENKVNPYFNTECNMLLLKMNKNNGMLAKSANIGFGSSGYDELDAIEPRNDGIYCGGWAQITTGVGNYEMGFLRLNYNLGILNQTTFGDPSPGSAEHQDGHMVVDNTHIFAAGLWNGNSWINNCCDGRAIVGKFQRNNFALTDTAVFGPSLSSANDNQNALGMATDGNYIYLTGMAQTSSVNIDMFVAKFDKNLNQKWIKYFGGTGGDVARAITVHNGYVLVGGGTNSTGYTVGGAYDAFLAVYDTAAGNLINYKVYGGTKDEEFRDIAAEGAFACLAGTRGTNMFSGGTSDEAFLVKVDLAQLVGEQEHGAALNRFRIFPNPSDGEISIDLSLASANAEIFISDITGRRIYDHTISNRTNTFELDLSFYPAGIYFCEIVSDGEREIRKLVITH